MMSGGANYRFLPILAFDQDIEKLRVDILMQGGDRLTLLRSVIGSVDRTLSPTRTSRIGLALPSAINTGVSGLKLLLFAKETLQAATAFEPAAFWSSAPRSAVRISESTSADLPASPRNSASPT